MNEPVRALLQNPIQTEKPWRAIMIVIIALVLVISLLWLWRASRSNSPGYTPPGPVDVVVTELKLQPAPVQLQAIGNLRAEREVTLSSEVAGRISVIAFEPGQHVNADVLLVKLDDTIERADLAAAKASAAFAEQQFERASKLAATGALAKEIFQQRRSERDQAQALIAQLEARIRQKSILSPFAGELGLRQVNLGQYLNAGDSAVTLTDLDSLYVNFDLPQQELSRIRVGQHVEVHGDTSEVKHLQAKITALDPQVGHETRNATIQAELANTQHKLRPGMYVTVAVSLPDEPDVLLVPSSAVITSSSGDVAIVVQGKEATKSGKAVVVPIQTGRRIGDQVIVTQGLKAGDVIVTEGQLRIQPGADLRVVQKSATTTGKE
ncbi:efflux RND transporter periplasmic adaptor subunit [Serratia fonticola]|uniref:efflux RND transporter periplasmic adaptor subunit n=1 Tax=Serratia fonticola TaxID=47917 RepID=UPI0015C5A5D9|nr:efflux RND transporter periplasmic adaptor subunit [Serratia fonticola]NYA43567.1 efflux RND transporter periplasmic adaptor subunit [Serratia fonticola]